MTLQFARDIFGVLDREEDPDEALPATWNSAHVGLRLTEAFATLQRMPRRDRLGYGKAWPSYLYDFDDLVEQQKQGELERTFEQQNRTRIVPSAVEIMHMETALFWPAQYLRANPELCLAVNMVAFAHSRGLDAGWVAQKRGGYADYWRQRHDEGCERIAAALIADRVTVF